MAKSWVWITRKHTDGGEERRAERRGKRGSFGSHSPPPQLIVVRTRQRLGPPHEGEAIRNETLEKLPMGCAGSSVLLAISRPFQHRFKGTQVPKQRHLPFLHRAGSTTKTTSLNPLKNHARAGLTPPPGKAGPFEHFKHSCSTWSSFSRTLSLLRTYSDR